MMTPFTQTTCSDFEVVCHKQIIIIFLRFFLSIIENRMTGKQLTKDITSNRDKIKHNTKKKLAY